MSWCEFTFGTLTTITAVAGMAGNVEQVISSWIILDLSEIMKYYFLTNTYFLSICELSPYWVVFFYSNTNITFCPKLLLQYNQLELTLAAVKLLVIKPYINLYV